MASCQTEIGAVKKRVLVQHRKSDDSKRLETVPGIGIIDQLKDETACCVSAS
jgi:hypothetical protein